MNDKNEILDIIYDSEITEKIKSAILTKTVGLIIQNLQILF